MTSVTNRGQGDPQVDAGSGQFSRTRPNTMQPVDDVISGASGSSPLQGDNLANLHKEDIHVPVTKENMFFIETDDDIIRESSSSRGGGDCTEELTRLGHVEPGKSSGDATNVRVSNQGDPAPQPQSPVHRAFSSPLITVCRHSHSHLVVLCQVNPAADTSSTSPLPLGFSLRWTEVARRVRQDSTSTRKRRHTVGPATASAEQKQSWQRHHHHHHRHHHRRGRAEEDPSHPDFQGRGRSHSDSEIQYLLKKAMGRELKRMSDEFNFLYTGMTKLAPVSESASDEESDSESDEM